MSEPFRVQLSRRKGWKMPPNTVKVARPGKWGNPWRVGMVPCGCRSAGECSHNDFRVPTAQDAADAYLEWSKLWCNQRGLLGQISELRGKNLACWCPLDTPCHADVLLKIANAEPPHE